MKRRNYRLGWVIGVLAMAAMACTCGALGQAQEAVQTAQALATVGSELSTQAQGFATQAATTGALETLEVASTEFNFGSVPDDIPVYPQNSSLIGTTEAVGYFAEGTVDEVTEFYKTEMEAQGWAQTQDPISTQGTAVLFYSKDNREATVSITESGGQTAVAITITTE